MNERPRDISLRSPSKLPGVLVEVDVSPESRSELVDVDGTWKSDRKKNARRANQRGSRFRTRTRRGGKRTREKKGKLTKGIRVELSERLESEAPTHLGGSEGDVSELGGESKSWVGVDGAVERNEQSRVSQLCEAHFSLSFVFSFSKDVKE